MYYAFVCVCMCTVYVLVHVEQFTWGFDLWPLYLVYFWLPFGHLLSLPSPTAFFLGAGKQNCSPQACAGAHSMTVLTYLVVNILSCYNSSVYLVRWHSGWGHFTCSLECATHSPHGERRESIPAFALWLPQASRGTTFAVTQTQINVIKYLTVNIYLFKSLERNTEVVEIPGFVAECTFQ